MTLDDIVLEVGLTCLDLSQRGIHFDSCVLCNYYRPTVLLEDLNPICADCFQTRKYELTV